MEMKISPVFNKPKRPILIAGPCSAETEKQVMETAEKLAEYQIDLFRAGIWKPRTRPNSFEGVGKKGLKWLKRVKAEFGLKTTTEVANTEHVFEALKNDIDVLWIGARTTVNPFSVQEVANALDGVDIPVMVKNPINPDLSLWLGAIERLYKSGITRIAIVHRGFSTYGESIYRNVPQWQIPIELIRNYPELQIICDSSHICGSRAYLYEVSQKALDLNYDGLMLESHICPSEALSDPDQQVDPHEFGEIIHRLIVREKDSLDPYYQHHIEDLRHRIDDIDSELMQLLSSRMKVADEIGRYKKRNNIAILQPARWNEIVDLAMDRATRYGLSSDFVANLLKLIHEESINHQNKIMNEEVRVEEKR